MMKSEQQQGSGKGIVLYSEATLYRNLSNLPFPKLMEEGDELELRNRIFTASQGLGPLELCDAVENLAPLRRKQLMEQGILQRIRPGDTRFLCLSEDSRSWLSSPEEEHLRICSRSNGMDIQDAFHKAREWEQCLESDLDYAFDMEFGYLCSDLTKSGTALCLGASLFLPAIAGSRGKEELMRILMEKGLEIEESTLYPEGEESEIIRIDTAFPSRQSEEDALNKFVHLLDLIVHYEKKARAALLEHEASALRDRVFRAYGTLACAERIDAKEADLLLLSLLLGVSTGLLGIHSRRIESLLFSCGDAALKGATDGRELSSYRADFLRENIGVERMIGGDDV